METALGTPILLYHARKKASSMWPLIKALGCSHGYTRVPFRYYQYSQLILWVTPQSVIQMSGTLEGFRFSAEESAEYVTQVTAGG